MHLRWSLILCAAVGPFAVGCGGDSKPSVDAAPGPDAAPAVPIAFASGQDMPCCVAIDDDAVYWINLGSQDLPGTVQRMGKADAEPSVLVDNLDYPFGLALDDTHVYWSDSALGEVSRLAKAGGDPQTLADSQYPWEIAVDADSVYWSNGDVVVKVAASGGTPVDLAGSLGEVLYVAVDTSYVYWTDESLGTIMRVGKGGGSPETLASGQLGPQALALTSERVYWVNRDDGTLASVAKAGGTPRTEASGLVGPAGIAEIDGSIYWSEAGELGSANGRVARLSSTGEVEVLADGQDAPWKLAADSEFLYWANQSVGPLSGAIMRLPR